MGFQIRGLYSAGVYISYPPCSPNVSAWWKGPSRFLHHLVNFEFESILRPIPNLDYCTQSKLNFRCRFYRRLCAPYNLIKAVEERRFLFGRKLSLSVLSGEKKKRKNQNLYRERICISRVARDFFHFGRVAKGANYLNQYDPLKKRGTSASCAYLCIMYLCKGGNPRKCRSRRSSWSRSCSIRNRRAILVTVLLHSFFLFPRLCVVYTAPPIYIYFDGDRQAEILTNCRPSSP